MTLVCADGQIPWEEPHETGEGYGMPPLIPGSVIRMTKELANSEEGEVYVLGWHA